jgi:hypothetical protein
VVLLFWGQKLLPSNLTVLRQDDFLAIELLLKKIDKNQVLLSAN